MKKEIIILLFLIGLLFIINYPFIDKAVKEFLSGHEFAIVERVIDGDTVVIENKTSVRLLGVNSPERGELYYNEAKDFLEELVFNKTIKLEFGKEKYDKYHRVLAYISVDGKNVNLELVEEGFANFYFPSGKDRYYKDFKKAWEDCIKENKNLCEKSEDKCADCIELKNFDFKKQDIIFYNNCDFDCDLTAWRIKHEGRKNFIFQKFVLGRDEDVKIKVRQGVDNEDVLFWKNEGYVWTSSGDTLFLRDDDGGLVLYEYRGY